MSFINPEDFISEEQLDTERQGEVVKMSLDKIKASGIFDSEYLETLPVVIFGENQITSNQQYINGEPIKDEKKFDATDFIHGKTTDFIGVNPINEYKNSIVDKESPNRLLASYFRKAPPYDEMVAHETAHNVFDLKYKACYGEYEAGDNPEISDDYQNKMTAKISELVERYYPKSDYKQLDIEKFKFDRQQISEIYTWLCEREYCRRTGENTNSLDMTDTYVQAFISFPDKRLESINSMNGKTGEDKCTMDDFYSENHILATIIAPLIEKEFDSYEKRLDFFFPTNEDNNN